MTAMGKFILKLVVLANAFVLATPPGSCCMAPFSSAKNPEKPGGCCCQEKTPPQEKSASRRLRSLPHAGAGSIRPCRRLPNRWPRI